MSVKIMTAVWSIDLPHTEKIVLLALADNASDEGNCYPSIFTLTNKCGLSERSVQRVIGSLAEAGHITCKERVGRSTVYIVHPRQAGTPDSVTPRTPDTHPRQADTHPPVSVAGGGATVAPITITQPSIEPSPNRHARKRATDSPEFLELMAIYPRRSGSQRWADCRGNINALLRAGHKWPDLLDSVRRYAEFCKQTGKLRTEGVQQAATFFGKNQGFLEPWDLPANKADTRLASNLDAAAEAKRRIFGNSQ